MDVTWNMWWTIGVIAAAVIIVLVIAAALLWGRSRRHPHEDEAIRQGRTASKSERLAEDARRERVDSYNLRDLPDDERARYVERWQLIQREFIADPQNAVSRADELVVAIMIARGFPGASDAALRTDDLRAIYPPAAESYKWAHHALGVSRTSRLNEADYRAAMQQYGNVFETLAPGGRDFGDGQPRLVADV